MTKPFLGYESHSFPGRRLKNLKTCDLKSRGRHQNWMTNSSFSWLCTFMHHCSRFLFSIWYEMVYKAIFRAFCCCKNTHRSLTHTASGFMHGQWPQCIKSVMWQPIWGCGGSSPFHSPNTWNIPLFFKYTPPHSSHLKPGSRHQCCRRKGGDGGELNSMARMDLKESFSSSFSSRVVRGGSHPLFPYGKDCAWCTTYNSRWSFSCLYCLGDPSKDAKHYRRCFLLGEGCFSFSCAAAEHFLELFKTLVYWYLNTRQRHSLSQEQRKSLQPHTDLKLACRSDHSFIPGLSRSRAGYKKLSPTI